MYAIRSYYVADLVVELRQLQRPIDVAIQIQGIEQQGQGQVGIAGLTYQIRQADQGVRQPDAVVDPLVRNNFV